MRRGRGKWTALLVAAALSLAAPTHVPAEQLAVLSLPRLPTPRLFGTREIHFSNMAQFTRWTNLLARWQAEREDMAEQCLSPVSGVAPCAPREWTDLIVRLRPLPLRAKIEVVNTAINAHPYVSALDNWGDPGRWETPFEFMRRNGQCQDYAITKFLLLRALGVPNDAMRLVVLRDVRRQVDHAVLVVTVDGDELMLDNLAAKVEPIAAAVDYRAYYSINETGWWLYLPNPLMPDGMASQVASR
jgi:predicted transglutaminase-like cysteine proteinase